MTTLFISHGAPTLAIEPGLTGKLLGELGVSLPKPRAILVVSAHWDTRHAKISMAAKPETIHDFGGFPQQMYEILYPANGAVELAQQTTSLLKNAGIAVELDANRGLDHGAWVPLMLMYPQADIPVTQLSIQSSLSTAHHLAIGQAISQLQDENVLILCSGAITHNLHDFFSRERDAKPLAYVHEFSEWIAQKVAQDNVEALLSYRKTSQYGVRAHPSEDHLMPFFVALGAGASQPVKRYTPEDTFGILAMDVYMWR